ncbi:MAG: type II secretion system protein GspK [Candidatus Zapsychrus exili]|nr:type II secretion system protein GspK [Candidatus Zapsychrus exili]
MKKHIVYKNNKIGSVLIVALWTLSFLTIFAVHIGLKVRQRVTLLHRIEDRSKLRFTAEAGIKKAVAILRQDLMRSKQIYSSYSKFYRHNNPEKFKDIKLNDGLCNVEYSYFDDTFLNSYIRYGIVDEESKININTVSRDILRRLVYSLNLLNKQDSIDLTEAIISWREFGSTQLEGFYSDYYYDSLKYPYRIKNAEFEIIDELLLVQGMTKEIFDKIEPFITIYGDGAVNINTASHQVLLSLGIDESVVNKIFIVRRGLDRQEATEDDYVFYKTHDIASEITQFVELKESEAKQIDSVNTAGLLTTNSYFYLIKSKGELGSGKQNLLAKCVYSVKENKFEYYRER